MSRRYYESVSPLADETSLTHAECIPPPPRRLAGPASLLLGRGKRRGDGVISGSHVKYGLESVYLSIRTGLEISE